MAYSVEQRSQEMGLRMALGAEPRHVIRLVAGQGLALIGAGVLFGLAASAVFHWERIAAHLGLVP